MLILLLATSKGLVGQSICIDTSTLSKVNHYLVEGAKARHKVLLYKEVVRLDSVQISLLDSIIKTQDNTIKTRGEEISSLKAKEKKQKNVKNFWKSISFAMFVLGLLL